MFVYNEDGASQKISRLYTCIISMILITKIMQLKPVCEMNQFGDFFNKICFLKKGLKAVKKKKVFLDEIIKFSLFSRR